MSLEYLGTQQTILESRMSPAPATDPLTASTFGPYKLTRTLGEGEFGKVKLAIHQATRRTVAIKLIRRDSLVQSHRHSKLLREIKILKMVEHPNIVKLIEVIETNTYIGVIMEYASGGELFEHILARKYLKEPEARHFFGQLLAGVSYLHSRKIVHRDLKLENLLLDAQKSIIITDFGFANISSQAKDGILQTSCGSPCYAAPELVINDGYVGEAADIWSCGVILYAMLCGYLPFDDDPANPDGENITRLYKYILETKLDFPEHVSPSAKHLMKRILVPDPAKRATLREIIQHPWLKSVQQYFTSPAPMAHEASVSTLVQEPAHHHQKQHSQKPQQQSQAQVTHVRSKTTKTQALVIEETATQRGKSVDILRSHQSSNQYNASKVSLGSGGDAAESQHSPQSYEMSKSMTHLPLTEPELARASASKQKGVSKEDVILLDNNAQSNDSSATTTLNSSPIHSQSSSIYQASTAFPKNPLSGSGSLSRLKYHHGPIDQRALSSKDPWSLLTDIATALIKQGMQVSFSDQPCRIKVVRQSNLTRGSAGSIKSSHSTHSLAGLITSFPLSLMRRIKYMATFGTSYNSGFDGSSTSSSSSRSQGPPSAASPTGGNQEEIRLYIEIQRIKNLPGLYLVEFKRLKGNIWAFKKLYQELIVALPVKDGKFVI